MRLVRPLCCDQPETLTQGYYPRVDSIAINASPHRREQLPRYNKHYKTTEQKLMALSACLVYIDGRLGWFVFPNRTYFVVLL